jgi:hypothetical protein
MRSSFRYLWLLQRYFGLPWIAYRIGYEAGRRVGLLERRTPVSPWSAQPLRGSLTDVGLADPHAYFEHRRTQSPVFLFHPEDCQHYLPFCARWDREVEASHAAGDESPIAQAEDVMRGEFRYFQHSVVKAGFPPPWHTNPFTGQQFPHDRHWSRADDFGHGDIKFIWELNRFGFTYPLVRAYWRTQDQRFAECFWQLIEDWRKHNPPQQGPNWGSGQEVSFRMMAWVFGLYGFLDCEATTPERVSRLAEMLAASGKRIAANLQYAVNQQNNHGISEGMGLWTLGLLFPEFRESHRWRETGRSMLESQGRELIYEDGAFAQHSVVYHRLMLHDYIWALRLGDLHGQPFSRALRNRVGAAGEFLYQMRDFATGQVPYYGQNDGSLILPLSNCGYLDFRPVIQASQFLCRGTRCYNDGPWDEELLWLFGRGAVTTTRQAPATSAETPQQRLEASKAPAPASDLSADAGGYYTIRSPEGFAFTRCGAFRHRPGQADMLHVDLWWRGQNLALDPGTFSYNAPPPWDNALARTICHNTASVDGRDLMDRAGRFLWLPWARGRVRCRQRSLDGSMAYFEGEHNGYQRLPAPAYYRRAILLLANHMWLVLDDLQSREPHGYRVHWLLPDLPYEWEPAVGQMKLSTPAGPYYVSLAAAGTPAEYSLVRADPRSSRGWRAPSYGFRTPALSLALVARAGHQTFWTVFGPHPARISVLEGGAQAALEGEGWRALLERGHGERVPLIASLTFSAVVDSPSAVSNRSNSRTDPPPAQSPVRFEISGCTFF